jgi:hypothetical protein
VGLRSRLLLVPLALIYSTTQADSQDIPRLALATGYSYMHALPADGAVSLNGWTARLMFKVTPRIRLAAQADGGYGETPALAAFFMLPPQNPGPPSAVPFPTSSVYWTQTGIKKHSLAFGPEVQLWRKRGITVNALAGAGVARGNTDAAVFFFMTSPDLKPTMPSYTGFLGSGGVSADVRLTDRLSYRLLQPEFVVTRLGSGWQWNVRCATGLVLNLAR